MRNQIHNFHDLTACFRARQSLHSMLSSRKHEKVPFRTQKTRPIPHSASPLANVIKNILTPHPLRILILVLPLLFAPLASAFTNTFPHSISSVSVSTKSSKPHHPAKKQTPKKAPLRRAPTKEAELTFTDIVKSEFERMKSTQQGRDTLFSCTIMFLVMMTAFAIAFFKWLAEKREKTAARLQDRVTALTRKIDALPTTDLDLSRVRTEVQKIMAGPSLIVNSLRSIRVDWRVAQAKETLNKFADLMVALISFRTAHRTLMSQEKQDELADAEFDEKISTARFKAKRAKKMSDALEDDGEEIDI